MRREARRPGNASAQRVFVLPTDDDLACLTQRAIEATGGMPALLGGRRVAIMKPNFVAGRPATTGATTDFQIIAAVAEAIHAAGATPLLCEFPGTEFDLESTYSILGLDAFCRRYEIGIVRNVDQWLEMRPHGARRLKRFRVPALLREACLINLPVLKTHVISGISAAMKNLMGLLPLEDRRWMHTFGIQQSIVDLNRGVIPDLNIVDGTVGQDGDGPLYGRAANLGVLIAGRDSLAVDLVCCFLGGIDPMAIGHLRLGLAQLGNRDPEIIGGAVTSVGRLALPEVSALYRLLFWLMFALDYPFHRLIDEHLSTALYKTGLIGTRPHIVRSACNGCRVCVDACPLAGTIDLNNFRVNSRTCQRCLLCFEACPEGAIEVAGMSGGRKAVAKVAGQSSNRYVAPSPSPSLESTGE